MFLVFLDVFHFLLINRSDLSQQKLCNQELIAQLELANNKVIEVRMIGQLLSVRT